MGVLKGLLGMARRGSDLLSEEEIVQLNKSMEEFPGFEPLVQNEMMPVTRDMAREFVEQVDHVTRGRMGGPLSSGDEYDAWNEHIRLLEILESPLFKGMK